MIRKVRKAAVIGSGIMGGGIAALLAGAGVKSMTFVPMGGNIPRPHPEFSRTNPEMYLSMGITAENVASRYHVSREDQDTFAADSQALYCIRELNLDQYMDRINIHGGAIALGHPLGCTGAKLTATCLAN